MDPDFMTLKSYGLLFDKYRGCLIRLRQTDPIQTDMTHHHMSETRGVRRTLYGTPCTAMTDVIETFETEYGVI